MASLPPPPASAAPGPSPQPGYAPPPPAPPRRRRRGCGCLGCLLVFVLVAALVAGAILYFGVISASVGVNAPATLTVLVPNVQAGHDGAGYAAAHTGRVLNAHDSIRTDAAGRAAISFTDGSITRLAPNTAVTLTETTVDSHGAVQRVTIDQLSGRTYHTVQRLLGGAYSVRGHGITTEVRGTEFEVVIAADGSLLIQLTRGRLHVGGGSRGVDLTDNQQVAITPDGRVGNPAPLTRDPADPFAIWVGPAGSETAARQGNQPGTLQTTAAAQPAAAVNQPVDGGSYSSPGGDLTATLSYPGSLMRLDVVGPQGNVVASGQGAPPIRVAIANAAPGVYRARVTPLILDHGPELWSVTFAGNPPCTASKPGDTQAGPVRLTLSDTDLNASLAQSGVTSHLKVLPSAGSAIVTGSVTANGVTLSGTFIGYAAPPNLGVTVAGASVNGLNVTGQASRQLAQLSGHSLDGIPVGFNVDRVYSCSGASGGLIVIEGHRL